MRRPRGATVARASPNGNSRAGKVNNHRSVRANPGVSFFGPSASIFCLTDNWESRAREREGVPFGIDADASAKLARRCLKTSVACDEMRRDENRWGPVREGSAGVLLLLSYPLLFTFPLLSFSQRRDDNSDDVCAIFLTDVNETRRPQVTLRAEEVILLQLGSARSPLVHNDLPSVCNARRT